MEEADTADSWGTQASTQPSSPSVPDGAHPLEISTIYYLLHTRTVDCRYAEHLEVVFSVFILGPLLKQILVLETSPDTTIDDGDGKIKTTLL